MAATVKYALRSRVTVLTYDDSYRDYVDPFPWAALRSQLMEKCEEAGIAFSIVGRDDGIELSTVNSSTRSLGQL